MFPSVFADMQKVYTFCRPPSIRPSTVAMPQTNTRTHRNAPLRQQKLHCTARSFFCCVRRTSKARPFPYAKLQKSSTKAAQHNIIVIARQVFAAPLQNSVAVPRPNAAFADKKRRSSTKTAELLPIPPFFSPKRRYSSQNDNP